MLDWEIARPTEGGSGLNIKGEVGKFIEEQLEDWSRTKVTDRKVVTDAVLGAMTFEDYEMHVIDCPIVQRMRRIHQLGPAFLLYPSANHTRFDHSLGVCTLADRIWRALLDKHGESAVPRTALRELRMAGILHDIGHGPFSHVSEEIMKSRFPEIKALIQDEKDKFWGLKPHEIMAYFILTSKPFMDFMAAVRNMYGGLELDMTRVAGIIIGRVEDSQQHQWKADIIHGRFDADKLDYMLRDAYFTGIKIEVDIERVILTLAQDSRDVKKIVGHLKGVHTLEQILFNKMFLFSALYHHHKLRSAECLVKQLYEYAFDSEEGIAGSTLDSPVDLMKLTDYDLLAGPHTSEGVKTIAQRIRNRELLYRALRISNHTVEDPSAITEITRLTSNLEMQVSLRKEINAKAKRSVESFHDIWIDIPEPPGFGDSIGFDVELPDNRYVDLNDLFELTQWLKAYATNKWTGHVYSMAGEQSEIREAALAVFEGYDLKFKNHA